MLLDICTELLEDIRNGWEYRELETETNEKDGTYILETLKYELGGTVYWRMVFTSNGERWEGGAVVCNDRTELLNCTPKILESLCNQAWYYNSCQVE